MKIKNTNKEKMGTIPPSFFQTSNSTSLTFPLRKSDIICGKRKSYRFPKFVTQTSFTTNIKYRGLKSFWK